MSNRVIKFRAWDKSSNRMVSFEELCNGDHDSWPDLYFALVPYNDNLLDRLVPLQFTGLLDKNGKEIYEGDIARWPSGINREIIWDERNACFSSKDVTLMSELGKIAILGKHLEMIGNIYENPNLLN